MEFPAEINRWFITGNSQWPCCSRRTSQSQTYLYINLWGVHMHTEPSWCPQC